MLIGKPNAGKTTLFNTLTGLNQKVGNYAGVTVEVKSGTFGDYKVIDIPGLQSLDTSSPEELISKERILELSPEENVVVFVANGPQLADSLVLYSQIADLQLPIILIINFKDELERNKIQIDQRKLEARLGCPIILMNSKTGEGLEELRTIVDKKAYGIPNSIGRSFHDSIEDGVYKNLYRSRVVDKIAFSVWEDDYNHRIKIIDSMIKENVRQEENPLQIARAQRWDKILLHPIYGLFIFLAVLLVVFQAVFSISSYPMDWIDSGMSSLSELANNSIGIPWLQELVADALIPGIGGVVIFIPQIAILFFLLGVLEQTGYLSRISFISDAFLRRFGLSGHSIIPLMSSWACAIPAIMSARVIADPKERLAVIFASPLMTCSARLPVYTILIAVIFPTGSATVWGAQGLALLILYLIGVVATLAVAWLVNRRSSVESNPYWILELPVFRMPNWKNIFINVYQKTKSFVIEAGKIILAISILLWFLSTNSPHDEAFLSQKFQSQTEQVSEGITLSEDAINLEYSYLGYMGKFVEPVIRPLGYDWKIGIGLITSFAAREVFVGTLSTIYSIGSEDESTIVERLRNEKVQATGEPRFSWATSISLLLFYVFALQCMSTLAIVRKETGTWTYPMLQFVFMLVLAYVFALVAYQLLSM